MNNAIADARAMLAAATARAKGNKHLSEDGARALVTRDARQAVRGLADRLNHTAALKAKRTAERDARVQAVRSEQPQPNATHAILLGLRAASDPAYRDRLSLLLLAGPSSDDERRLVGLISDLPDAALLGLPASDLLAARRHATALADADPEVLAISEDIAALDADLRATAHALREIHPQLDATEIAGVMPPKPSELPQVTQQRIRDRDRSAWSMAEASTGVLRWADPTGDGYSDAVNALAGVEMSRAVTTAPVADEVTNHTPGVADVAAA